MLDRAARKLIDPPLNQLGHMISGYGIGANQVTLAGLIIGLLAAVSIAAGYPLLALGPLLISRVADGLDGAVARATSKTDFGGYLDIVCDFVFYGAIPMAFAIHDPGHATAAAFLLTSFYVNGTSFLGFAILAEKRGMETNAQGEKSLYFSNGLLEGSETILLFVAMCIWPQHFAILAYVFGTLTFITAALRLRAAWHLFNEKDPQ